MTDADKTTQAEPIRTIERVTCFYRHHVQPPNTTRTPITEIGWSDGTITELTPGQTVTV